jgi:hypothetical protein
MSKHETRKYNKTKVGSYSSRETSIITQLHDSDLSGGGGKPRGGTSCGLCFTSDDYETAASIIDATWILKIATESHCQINSFYVSKFPPLMLFSV